MTEYTLDGFSEYLNLWDIPHEYDRAENRVMYERHGWTTNVYRDRKRGGVRFQGLIERFHPDVSADIWKRLLTAGFEAVGPERRQTWPGRIHPAGQGELLTFSGDLYPLDNREIRDGVDATLVGVDKFAQAMWSEATVIRNEYREKGKPLPQIFKTDM